MLEWVGPLTVVAEPAENLFLHPKALGAGVYIWTVPVNQQHWGYYVGQTGTSFAQRHFEHLRSYFTGEYQIYEVEPFARGEKITVWEGAYGSRNRHKLPLFRSRFYDYALVAQSMISLFRFFLIPVSQGERMRERLEAAISGALRAANRPASDFQDQIQYHPTRKGEDTIEYEFWRPLPIVGLDNLASIVLAPPS